MKKLLATALSFAFAVQLYSAQTEQVVKNIKTDFVKGQVFITWEEGSFPAGTKFNVYASANPITKANLKDAKKIAHHIEEHSARNWWRDPASFTKNAKASKPEGFVIESGKAPIDPAGGLFVHTPTPENAALAYYAVTSTAPDSKESLSIVPGDNATTSAAQQSVELIDAIWQGNASEPKISGNDKALLFRLHARTGGAQFTDPDVYIVFGTAEHGWREGLPFAFKIEETPDRIIISPANRFFPGRILSDSWDSRDHVPAVENFWFGYNEFIYDKDKMKDGKVINYTENILLSLRDWAVRKFSIDKNKVYFIGSSMGGCGSVSNAIHHPEEYAAVCARVPIVSYTNPEKGGSARRLESFCGKGKDIRCSDGELLLERMNGEKCVRKTTETLPFLFLLHGRQDASIPWENNPGFYKALDESRQGYMAYWDNGDHATAGANAPADIKEWLNGKWLPRFSSVKSFPAFSNCSTNKNPGNGEKNNGDIEGWLNRGMSWENIKDQDSLYAITVKASYPGIQYPVTVDMTPRRVQNFKPAPGEELTVKFSDGQTSAITVDPSKLFTVKGIKIASEKGERIIITRKVKR